MNAAQPFFRQRWFFAVMIAFVLGSAFLMSRFLLNNPPVAERQAHERTARLVEAQSLQREAEQVEVKAYGLIEAAQATTLSSRVAGEVIELAPGFVPGAQVSKGQWLVRIDPSDYELAVQEAKAGLASAKAALAQEQGQQAVARADARMLGMQVSEDERQLMLRQPQLASARATVDNAQAVLDKAQLNLQRTEVRAPYDGSIRSRAVSLGTQLASNTAIAEMAASAPYWVTLRLPVESLRWVQWPSEGQAAGSKVSLVDAADPDGPDWEGRVIQLLPGLESEGRRAGVLVQIDAPNAGERPLLLGTYVQALIHGRVLEQAFRLDTTWVHEGSAWIIDEGQLRQRPLEIAYSASDHVLVTAGLEDADHIVTSVPSGFVEGMRVRTQSTEAKPAAKRPQAESGDKPAREPRP